MGHLSLAKGAAHTARFDFETALTHAPNHPEAIVGLSHILLDIYSEALLPPPPVAPLEDTPLYQASQTAASHPQSRSSSPLPSIPLGLVTSKPSTAQYNSLLDDELPIAYKATRLPLVDRLAARDRACALLSTVTKLGSSWNSSEAWFALARAHEESGQPDKAKDVLWWCVELEEGTGVRDWRCLGSGGYII